ncbi:MAG TPA: polysaccharide biosynthesis/export family protein [Polyangiaceae bacterium]|jgi:polysaccharide export outer membrane protein
MSRFGWFAACALIAQVACTSSRPPPPQHLPPPIQSTSIGRGDVFSVQLVGEKDLPTEYRVQPDGSIDYPFVGRVTVAGLEPQEVVDLLRKRLIEGKYLSDPQMSLIVKEYNSKRVQVIGQVGKPGAVSYTEGMKLVDALSQAGWFTAIADTNHVILIRAVSPEKTVTAVVSVEAITDGEQADIPLQAGDTVKVESRVF